MLMPADNPLLNAPNVREIVEPGWSRSGSNAAPVARTAPTAQLCGDSWPIG